MNVPTVALTCPQPLSIKGSESAQKDPSYFQVWLCTWRPLWMPSLLQLASDGLGKHHTVHIFVVKNTSLFSVLDSKRAAIFTEIFSTKNTSKISSFHSGIYWFEKQKILKFKGVKILDFSVKLNFADFFSTKNSSKNSCPFTGRKSNTGKSSIFHHKYVYSVQAGFKMWKCSWIPMIRYLFATKSKTLKSDFKAILHSSCFQ